MLFHELLLLLFQLEEALSDRLDLLFYIPYCLVRLLSCHCGTQIGIAWVQLLRGTLVECVVVTGFLDHFLDEG